VIVSAADQHLCWSYDDPEALRADARAYLAEGLAAGERAWFAGDPGASASWLPDGVELVALDTAYPAGTVVDPEAQVAAYAAATDAALAAGHTGLRVFADCTSLVRTDAQLEAFAHYETLIDGYIATAPMRAVCALHRPALGDRTVRELACLHPRTNADNVRFALRGDPAHAGTALLSGELDTCADTLLPAALGRVRPRTIDARDLRFIDHRALLHLQRHAEQRDIVMVLRTPLSTAPRLVELLGLTRVRIEVAA
jgi:hypothetical protein